MSKNKESKLPSSGSGLVSYSSDYKSKISFKPGFVIVISSIIILLLIILNLLR